MLHYFTLFVFQDFPDHNVFLQQSSNRLKLLDWILFDYKLTQKLAEGYLIPLAETLKTV